jgi:hypothetical protein
MLAVQYSAEQDKRLEKSSGSCHTKAEGLNNRERSKFLTPIPIVRA